MMEEAYRDLLEQAKTYALEYLRAGETAPPFPREEDLRRLPELSTPLPQTGTPAQAVLADLEEIGRLGTTRQVGGRYFGFVNGGILPVAQAAQWLADSWNQNSALYVMSPAVAQLEAICERWMAALLGLETGTAMGLVTGASNAIICALAAARNELLLRQGYDVAARGMRHAPKLRVVLGAEAHATVRSALKLLGVGREEIETVPTDAQGRLDPEKLPPLDEHTLLILQAGNVNGGAFDDFAALCPLAKQAGAWVHIDGAFGLWAAASRTHRHLTAGIEQADSWSLDAHKTLNAGYDCGIVLCRDRAALTRAMQADGEYISYSENARDGMCYATEMSRRARAVPLWAVLKCLGAEGVEQLVDRLCGHALSFAQGLEEAGFHLAAPVCFNQFMVYCETEEQTAAVLERVQNSGVCWCGSSRWHGRLVLRLSVCSHATTQEDIQQSIQAFRAALT